MPYFRRCIPLLVLPFVLVAQGLPTLAVIDLEAFGLSNPEAASLTNRLRSNITKLGKYQMIERGMMAEILQEQDFQMSGCTSDECAVEIGQLLGAQFMLSGTIGRVGSTWTIEMRIVDVGTGAIIRTASYDTRGEIDVVLTDGMAAAAAQITGVDLQFSVLATAPTNPAFINIISSLPDASISVDNNAVGTGNASGIEIRPGVAHKISASLDRYHDADSTVILGPGERGSYRLVLQPKLGKVEFKGVGGATLKVDGVVVGKTPNVTKHTLQMGNYDITIIKPGHHAFESTLLVNYNQVTTLSYTLKPKPKIVGFTGSLIVPGGGQLYMGEKFKSIFFLAASAALGFLAYSSQTVLIDDQDAYNAIRESYLIETDPEQISLKRAQVIESFDAMTSSETTRNQMLAGLGAVWAINLIDITF